VPSEEDALKMVRTFLAYLPSNNVENPPFIKPSDNPARMDEALNHIIPLDPATPYVMHQVIERIVDEGSFLEIQPAWARNAIVGLARIGGHSVGIVGQEPAIMAGVIDIDASDKMTRFVRMCDCFNIPIVTFVDSPGFLPGIAQEHGGIIRHGAKLLYAYSEATVPKVCIITRKAYGGAYVVMSSKYLGTDVTYAWPSAEIAVLGAEGAANILFKKQIETAPNPALERKHLADEYREKFNNPYYAAAGGYVDDIIEPKESRPKIIAALSALRDKYAPAPPRKHGNIPV
jgi:propionyl-CoA carboxylase beta chain